MSPTPAPKLAPNHSIDAADPSQSPDPLPPGRAAETDNLAAREVDTHYGSASNVLQRIADAASEQEISVGAVIDGLEDRAFGMMILLFAIPALIPFLVGVHSAVSIPIALLAWQILRGRKEPWLPERVRRQRISVEAFRKMTKATVPWLKRVEALTQPRFEFLVGKGADRVLALVMIFLAGVIAIPGPGTNGVPGLCVGLIAIGFIERDGLLASIGVVLGLVYSALFFTIGYAAIVFGLEQMMRIF